MIAPEHPENDGERPARDRIRRVSDQRRHLWGAALGVLISLAGCATIEQHVDSWFGRATPTPTTGAARTPGPSVYYAGAEGLPVYSAPSTSSAVVGKLARYEKVTRFKLEHGHAYVEGASGLKGWVNNAQLLWRLPTVPTSAAPAAEEQQPEEPAAPAAEEPQEATTPEATATATESLPTTTPARAAPKPTATPGGLAPSIFNPY